MPSVRAESSSATPGTAARRPRAANPRPAKRAKTSSGHRCKKSSKPLVLGVGEGVSTALAAQAAAAVAQTAAACKVPKFLRSLYAILQTEDPRVIAWVQNEELKPNCVTAFHILDMARFEREILPKYFKHQKFASFQRQLNNFGFRKWTKTQSSGVCTFSHNNFPPDPTTANKNESIRDQWRRKSTQVIPPATAAAARSAVASSSAAASRPTASRRRITANDATTSQPKQEQRQVRRQQHSEEESNGENPPEQPNQPMAPRRRPAHVQVQVQTREFREPPPFTDMYRSPNANGSADSSAYRHSQSHQPRTKKLARPGARPSMSTAPQEPLNGLEAFCEDSFKQFILPPLQPHHLLTATSRGVTPTGPFTSSRIDVDAPSAFGGFRHSLQSVMNHSSSGESSSSNLGYKTCEYPDKPHAYYPPGAHPSGSSSTGAADAAALQGTFLEPWMWDAQASSSGFELGAFPMEFDWQEAPTNYYYAGANGFAPPPMAMASGLASNSSSCSSNSSSMTRELSQCHQQDRGVPSNAEEFGLDNLLFVE